MKLNEGIEILKAQYPEHIILVQNGLFYIAVGDDALILSQEFELSKICFSKGICVSGQQKDVLKPLKFGCIINTEKFRR